MSEARAPGKLVLCGEYGVLHGAPAIAVAVDTQARASVQSVHGSSRLHVMSAGEWAFDWSADGTPLWREPPADGRGGVLEAVAAAVAARGAVWTQPVEIRLDSRAFEIERADGRGDKLGLGSSAAISVALTAALLAAAGRPSTDRAALTAICVDAHRRLQDGRGSGIDVAAAVHGGVVTLVATAEGPVIGALTWPSGLHALAAWTGTAASTPAMLARFEAFSRADTARFERSTAELRRIGGEAVVAWRQSRTADVLRALVDYDDALRALDDGANLGIYTPAHERLARMAQEAGAAYKVSGAGGGDFGVAFTDSAAVATALQARWAAEQIVTLRLGGGVPGVTLS